MQKIIIIIIFHCKIAHIHITNFNSIIVIKCQYVETIYRHLDIQNHQHNIKCFKYITNNFTSMKNIRTDDCSTITTTTIIYMKEK